MANESLEILVIAEEKIQFLTELAERRSLCPGGWLLIGDFNMILRASEKNNTNLDRASMTRFGTLLVLWNSRNVTCMAGPLPGAMRGEGQQ
jgi:hypothetical protein